MFTKKNSFKELDKKLRMAFSAIKEEMNDHLDAINENTAEIQANYNYIKELEEKLEKLNNKIDEVFLLLGKYELPSKNFVSDYELTIREQEIFVVLYTNNDQTPLSCKEIARKTGLTEELVMENIENLIKKGIPVLKNYEGQHLKFNLDPYFRQLQTKQNVVQLRRDVVSQLSKV